MSFADAVQAHFLRSGKVRDLYELPDHRLVLMASDRISAFDVVMPTVVPDKGRVLTGLSRFWFAETALIVPGHLLGTDPAIVAEAVGDELDRATTGAEVGSLDDWRGRIMICRPTAVLPIENVVRGFLSGSGWKEYQETGKVCGVRLRPGLRESERLPEPIFTPALKAPAGHHDENVTFDGMIGHLRREMPFLGGDVHAAGELAERVRELSIALYRYGCAISSRAGILVADTKFEFGLAFTDGSEAAGPDLERIPPGPPRQAVIPDLPDGSLASRVMLIDEVLTPDSSRFWDASTWEPGRAQASYDKQFVRDWLEAQPWDKTAPGPQLPDDVVAGTRARYVEAYERITGASFARYLQEDVIAP